MALLLLRRGGGFAAATVLAVVVVALVLSCGGGAEAAVRDLRVGYYAETCPDAEAVVRDTMARARAHEARSVASVMRLQFHDCFVNVRPRIGDAIRILPFLLLRRAANRSALSRSRFVGFCVCVCVLFLFGFSLHLIGRSAVIWFVVFEQGCDGSVLMDATPTMAGEKEALSNINSLRSFDVVDEIKEALEERCPGVVSCADIIVMAARDAVALVRTHTPSRPAPPRPRHL